MTDNRSSAWERLVRSRDEELDARLSDDIRIGEFAMKGLIVNVYRTPGYNCALGGVSEKYNKVLLVGDGVAEVFEAGDLPVVQLVKRTICGNEYLHVKPVEQRSSGMFGGNFIYTSDSRFPNGYPIPVHDRVEQ